MAIDFNQNYFRNSAGVQWEILGRLSLDASYPTGGYLVDPAQIGLDQITSLLVNDAQNGYLYDFDTPNSKLKVFASGGGGTFTGDPLVPHSHNLQQLNVVDVFTTWRIYHGAVVGGPFVVGETVTDGTYTAVVSAVAADHLDFNAHTGALQYDVPLTGGTSGATTTSTSVFLGYFTPASTPFFLSAGALSPANPGVESPFSLTPAPSTAIPQFPGEMRFNSVLGVIEACVDVADGSTNDHYMIDYIIESTSGTSGGTPSGTITGGGGALIEVPNGTNLSAVQNVEYRAVGL